MQLVIKPQHDIAWPTLASTPWPKARHDAQCTGRSSYAGPQLGRVKASVHLNSWGGEDPAVGPDSVFYVVSDTSLFAVTFNSNILWKAPLKAYVPNDNDPLIGSNGIIYVGSSGVMSAFRPDGSLLWQTNVDGEVYLKACGIGLDGNIYLCTSNASLYAIDRSGNIVWHRSAPGGQIMWCDVMTLSFSPDGSRFYLGGNTATQSLYVLNTSGIVVRTDSLGAPQYGAISIDNDGNVFSYFGGNLVSISDSGKVRWRIQSNENYNVTIDPNGNVGYLSDGNLVSVDNNGQERWRVFVQPLDFYTHLVCDAQGTVYTETSADYKNYDVQAISDKGKLLWTLSVPAYLKYGGPSLTREGYLLLPLYGPGIPEPPQLYIIE